jgi:hypothetical protein
MISWAENSIAEKKFEADVTALTGEVDRLKTLYDNQSTIIDFLTECKNQINLCFNKLYSRFI